MAALCLNEKMNTPQPFITLINLIITEPLSGILLLANGFSCPVSGASCLVICNASLTCDHKNFFSNNCITQSKLWDLSEICFSASMRPCLQSHVMQLLWKHWLLQKQTDQIVDLTENCTVHNLNWFFLCCLRMEPCLLWYRPPEPKEKKTFQTRCQVEKNKKLSDWLFLQTPTTSEEDLRALWHG